MTEAEEVEFVKRVWERMSPEEQSDCGYPFNKNTYNIVAGPFKSREHALSWMKKRNNPALCHGMGFDGRYYVVTYKEGGGINV